LTPSNEGDGGPPPSSQAPLPSQRRWQAACPNCGAPLEFASAASASAVCSYCRSSLLREGEALRKIGQSAELIEDYSPLQLGASGRYMGAGFTVVGRLQLGYADGQWNEWHLLFDGEPDSAQARSAWLSEDNGSFVLSFDAALQLVPPQAHELVLGASQILAGQNWQIAALTPTTLLAAQGELPRPPELAREYLVAELRNAQDEVGTLDYSPALAGEPPLWSVGRAVRIAELAMRGLREDNSKTLQAQSLSCPSCGAALTPKLGTSLSIVCEQCHAVVDITKTNAAELPHYEQTKGMEPQLKLGSLGRLAFADGPSLPWQVLGYQERCDLPDPNDEDAEQTFWREYLLFNKQEGFVFLVDSEDGWSLVRPLTGAPTQSRSLGASIEWQGKTFRRRYAQSYTAKTTYVLGEFYWQVKREERALVSDYEYRSGSQRELLSREQTGREITWSWGRSMDASEVARAFGLPLSAHAGLRSDASSLSSGGSGNFLRNVIIGLFIFFIVILMIKAMNEDDCDSYRKTYGENSAEYAQCKRSGGTRISTGGGSGGSYGGFGSSGGGHK